MTGHVQVISSLLLHMIEFESRKKRKSKGFSSTRKRMHKMIMAHLQGLKIHLLHFRGIMKGFILLITNDFDWGFLEINLFP